VLTLRAEPAAPSPADHGEEPEPDAGRLFTVRPGVTGPPAQPYRGPLAGLRPAV
jgi:hypothetical protein